MIQSLPKVHTLIKKYIDLCIEQSCEAEGRENDVRYWYKIINDELLFFIRTKYNRVKRRIIHRMLRNLPKNFGLTFTLVYPYAVKEGMEYLEKRVYDIMSIDTGIDPNYAIDLWKIDGQGWVIRSAYGNHPDDGELNAMKHLNALKEHGYDYMKIEDRKDWKKFYDAFFAVYGMTPFDMSQQIWKEHKHG